MKIESKGSSTSGSMMPSITPMLMGRVMSKPRTCRIAGIFIDLFSLLHLISEDAFDHCRISLVPAAKIVHCERVLDGCEFLVFFIQRFIRAGAEMESDKLTLSLFAPEKLHKRVNDRPICG